MTGFRSFRGRDVPPPLRDAADPDTAAFLDRTASLCVALTSPSPSDVDAYAADLARWLDRVDASCATR